MSPAHYLVDTSALVRLLRDKGIRRQWERQVSAGIVAVCPLVELEMLYTARSPADRSAMLQEFGDTFCWVGVPDRVYERAAEVQAALTERGSHRGPGPMDLLIAATAELQGLVLLHHDRDFDQVAQVTGQPVHWLAAPGPAQR